MTEQNNTPAPNAQNQLAETQFLIPGSFLQNLHQYLMTRPCAETMDAVLALRQLQPAPPAELKVVGVKVGEDFQKEQQEEMRRQMGGARKGKGANANQPGAPTDARSSPPA